MQLMLKLDDRTQTLAEIHRRLQSRFGQQGPFVQLDPVSQLVMGLVGGKTHSDVSRAAFEALLMRFRAWEAVRDAPVAEIRVVIDGVTFAEIKAPRLKAALETITKIHGRLTLDSLERMTVEEALAWLERLPGVGRKIAAATLNFSILRKAALVIDTHHLRVLRRLTFVARGTNLKGASDRIVPLLPPDWLAADLDEHHQLMKTLGQTICRHSAPICRLCPLQDLCPTALADSGRRRPYRR